MNNSNVSHVHDESASSKNTHAEHRYSGEIQSRNFRIVRTNGTDTKFSLTDLRTLNVTEFDHCRVGMSMGRGDTVQFYVGEVDLDEKLPHIDMRRVGDYYQHDLDDEILDVLEYIEKHNEMPGPDPVVSRYDVAGGSDA